METDSARAARLASADGLWAGRNGRAAVARMAPGLRSRVRVDGKFFARGRDRFRVHGVTYGPFAPGMDGDPFPGPDQVRDDFARMRDAGVNSVRTYHVPPEWLLRLADQSGLGVLIDVPWPKHLCFLDSPAARRHARDAVRRAALRGRNHPCVLAYSVGNEIPANVVRWHGAGRVERFVAELADVARQADPDGLVTYASFPPTEYLDLSALDFVTFNVYLHDPAAFRRYLLRLQNLVGDRPLLLGEIGMDTLRHGELAQADHLGGHVREVLLAGLAGAFVFSWTDDWHTGGHPIRDWAFGVTAADRTPKPAYHALREVFEKSPAELLDAAPRASVVVCTYNGGATLDQCLRSLLALDYPDYEVLVVDDGSTDRTRDVLDRYPAVRAIHQPNLGLSAARNAGLRAATGEVVAYTDSDCFADRDWLTHLVHQLHVSGADAVGGPNLSPEDGWLAGCVAVSPGQPVHVLESDQVAEHVPGCNMAFRREALEAIGGFDPVYRKAGDDVDVCWRLHQSGRWITFAPGAFVWHHRRQTARAYLRQQAGYGEAEALLRLKHPDRFNGFGDGKWRGVLYGAAVQGLRLGRAIVHRGTFGTGLFQCIYRPGPAHWAMLPSTLEWHVAAAVVALTGRVWHSAWVWAAVMLSLSLLVAAAQAAQARLAPRHDGLATRAVVMALCYLQPLVRSWKRYQTRLLPRSAPSVPTDVPDGLGRLPLSGRRENIYWSEEGRERTDLLGRTLTRLAEHRWGAVVDPGWSDWDLEVHGNPWTTLQVCTAQEEHGGARHLIRVRYRLRLGGLTRLAGAGALATLALAAALPAWPAAVGAAVLAGAGLAGWWQGVRRASAVVGLVDAVARGELGMTPLTGAGAGAGTRNLTGADT